MTAHEVASIHDHAEVGRCWSATGLTQKGISNGITTSSRELLDYWTTGVVCSRMAGDLRPE
jgi:hypothetical protein